MKSLRGLTLLPLLVAMASGQVVKGVRVQGPSALPAVQAASLSVAASLRPAGMLPVSASLSVLPSLPSLPAPVLAPGSWGRAAAASPALEAAPAVSPVASEVSIAGPSGSVLAQPEASEDGTAPEASAVDSAKSMRRVISGQDTISQAASFRRVFDGARLQGSVMDAVDASGAQAPAAQAVQGKLELSGRQLLDAVGRSAQQGHQPKGYDEARRYMFSVSDNVEVRGARGVADAYSDVFVPGASGSGGDYRESGDQNGDGYVDRTGMNAEHVWPQSFFNKRSPMRSDLHNLMPTFMHPNSLRGHLPFGKVSGSVEYSNNAGAKLGGGVFEPPDGSKGRVARALLYFFARYQGQGIFSGDFGPGFWNSKLELLLEWNRNFPPSNQERGRNALVERFQGNRNPFIDDPSLADRIGVEGLRLGEGSRLSRASDAIASSPWQSSNPGSHRRHHGRGKRR